MPLEPADPLARFLVHRSQYRTSPPGPKAVAFLPGRDHETSVFAVGGLAVAEVWALADRHVAAPRQLEIHASAQLLVRDVADTGLRVEPSEPPPRHATLRGWPAEKHERLAIAQALARVATLVVRDH